MCDVTRKATLTNLDDWVEGVFGVTGEVPVEIMANKVDLVDETTIEESEIEEAAESYQSRYHFTSAKTGEHVDEAFLSIAQRVAAKLLDH